VDFGRQHVKRKQERKPGMNEKQIRSEIEALIQQNQIPELKTYLHHRDHNVRKFAVKLMANQPSGYVSQLLFDLFADPKEEVRAEVYQVTWERERESNCKYALKKLKDAIDAGEKGNAEMASATVNGLWTFTSDIHSLKAFEANLEELGLSYLLGQTIAAMLENVSLAEAQEKNTSQAGQDGNLPTWLADDHSRGESLILSEEEKEGYADCNFNDWRGFKASMRLVSPVAAYYPGDVVRVHVDVEASTSHNIDTLKVHLVCKEDYRYTPVALSVSLFGYMPRTETNVWLNTSKTLLNAGGITDGFQQSFEVDFQIPEGDILPTYQGDATQVYFQLQLRGFPTGIVEGQKIKVIIPPPNRNIDPVEIVNTSHQLEVRLRLPRLEWTEGETVQGWVLVRTLVPNVSPVSTSIHLMWEENIPEKPGESHAENKFVEIAHVKTADKTTLPMDHYTSYPFQVTIPKSTRPTLQTLTTMSKWTLVASASTGVFAKVSCVQSLDVYTAPAHNRPERKVSFANPEIKKPDAELNHAIKKPDAVPIQPQELTPQEKRRDVVRGYIKIGGQVTSESDEKIVVQGRSRAPGAPLVILFFMSPLMAILYYFFSRRFRYQTEVYLSTDGEISESGHTIADYQEGERKNGKIGWLLVLANIVLLMFVCLWISSYGGTP
jgi:hypothetical protein